MDLIDSIVKAVRSYKGLTRKREIGSLLPFFKSLNHTVIAAKGEDAAVISFKKSNLILAADGIIQDLIDGNPEWAGYCSILVNLNDILSMGAKPIAAVNTISAKDESFLKKIVSGMVIASDKFGIPMVGGHLHPESSSNSISVAMLGTIESGKPILSSTASEGDAVLSITDCRGEFTAGFPFSWDCTSKKSRKEMSDLIKRIQITIGSLRSAKDVSNPGVLGTIAMLLESSGVGAEINIEKIPKPGNVDLIQWLTAYQGFGFIGTTEPSRTEEIKKALNGSGIDCSVIGTIIKERVMKIRMGDCDRTLFDFSRDKITGLF